ncbi:hypothetical protein ACFWP7_32785 [Streptomyces sp. NPDC058470]|uniref:hypothetical protein n=1 Tax=Streptomyces sp. NPDC058470 TaxID=3346515 RepID=UPI003648F31F
MGAEADQRVHPDRRQQAQQSAQCLTELGGEQPLFPVGHEDFEVRVAVHDRFVRDLEDAQQQRVRLGNQAALELGQVERELFDALQVSAFVHAATVAEFGDQ